MWPRLVLGIAIATAIPATGRAQDATQDTTEVARGHFEAGTRAFDTGDYELAAREFHRAHELTGHPDLLFNVYASAERAGQLAQAAAALERFLAEGEVEPERRPILGERLARLRARIAPEPRVVEQEPEPQPQPQSGVHPAGIVTLGAAGALGVAFAALAIASEVEDGALAGGCGRDGTCSTSELETLNALNIAADVSWIAASITAVAGVVLLFVLPPEPSGPSAVLVPWATPEAAGLALVGRTPLF